VRKAVCCGYLWNKWRKQEINQKQKDGYIIFFDSINLAISFAKNLQYDSKLEIV
jgi:hypothetical protein